MYLFIYRSLTGLVVALATMALISAPVQAATGTGTLNVSAIVPDFCELTSSTVNLNMGTYLPSTESSVGATVQVRCTVGTAANIGLGLGLNASGSTRRMQHATDPTVYLNYELYKADGTTIWQAPGQAGVVAVTGDGLTQGFNVVGKIPSNQWSIKKGNYADTVVITVTFPDP